MKMKKTNIKIPLLSVDEALQFIINAARPVSTIEIIPTLSANGRVLAQAQSSMIHVPPMDNTQMDGYAVRSVDCVSGNARLLVSQRIPAGVIGHVLEARTAARIFTGAFIPQGANAVVMQEQCSTETIGNETYVTVQHTPQPGEWIRRQGEDISAQATILEAGTRLQAQELGLAASVGIAHLPVFKALRVAIFFTGDELTMPGEALKPGAIYNSNRFVLNAMLNNLGCEVTDFGIIPDTLEATRDTLRKAAQEHDLIITSGGVSVGEEDHIRPAVQAEGELALWQIAMKPGKPLAFGEVRRDDQSKAFFLGLPGNPVSSFVTFSLFVRPFILRMLNVTHFQYQSFMMRADFDWLKPGPRNEFLRVKINTNGGLDLFPNQSSGVLNSVVWGDGLLDLASGQSIHKDDMVKFIPFSSFQ
jgi:molybdopterin molybdotransferase